MRTTHKLLALALVSSVMLASCGGGDKTTPPTTTTPPTDSGTVSGGTITKPADATAAGEFVITGERAIAAASVLRVGPFANSGLSAQDIKAQAIDAELRVLVAVTRSTSGTNAGKKKAVATFVWGNQSEQITANGADATLNPAVTLDIYPQGNAAMSQTYKGSLDLKVVAPDFQDKTTRSGVYVNDSGPMCARLVVDLKSLPNSADPKKPTPNGYTPYLFNTTAAPLEVCEGDTEKQAEFAAITKYSNAVQFNYQSAASAPWTFERFEGEAAVPTAARLIQLENLPANAAVNTQAVSDFFGPLEALPAGDSATWTTEQKAAAATARKYTSLRKQLGYYYQGLTVYRVDAGNGRENIYIFGKNGWGVGGIKTIRFIP